MITTCKRLLFCWTLVLTTVISSAIADEQSGSETSARWREVSRLDSPQAIQGAVTYKGYVFAVNSRQIAKHDRSTGELLGISQGDAVHLNSGFVWRGKILSAHSNYPNKPERSEVMALDPKTMKLSRWHDFGDYGGSLTWIVRRGNHWLGNFARYGEDNAETFLVEFDNMFRERRRWVYPAEVIQKLGSYSLSGGVWLDGALLVTGHDEQEVYVLEIPQQGNILKYRQTMEIPFTGQGFAVDRGGRGLVGISRAERQVIFVRKADR